MKVWAIGLLLLVSAALSGCQSSEDKDMLAAPKPLDKMSTEEWCAFYGRYVASPQVSAEVKAKDLRLMKERGCPAAG